MKTDKLRIVLDLDITPERLSQLIELSAQMNANNGLELVRAVSVFISEAKVKTVYQNEVKNEIEVFGLIK